MCESSLTEEMGAPSPILPIPSKRTLELVKEGKQQPSGEKGNNNPQGEKENNGLGLSPFPSNNGLGLPNPHILLGFKSS